MKAVRSRRRRSRMFPYSKLESREAKFGVQRATIQPGLIMSNTASSNDAALNERLSFIGLEGESCVDIARLRPMVERELPRTLN
jgi:hypothetical protein